MSKSGPRHQTRVLSRTPASVLTRRWIKLLRLQSKTHPSSRSYLDSHFKVRATRRSPRWSVTALERPTVHRYRPTAGRSPSIDKPPHEGEGRDLFGWHTGTHVPANVPRMNVRHRVARVEPA